MRRARKLQLLSCCINPPRNLRTCVRARQKSLKSTSSENPNNCAPHGRTASTKKSQPPKMREWQRKLPFLFLSIILIIESFLYYIFIICVQILHHLGANVAPPRTPFCTTPPTVRKIRTTTAAKPQQRTSHSSHKIYKILMQIFASLKTNLYLCPCNHNKSWRQQYKFGALL